MIPESTDSAETELDRMNQYLKEVYLKEVASFIKPV
jgi:hypothetical protein